MPDLQCCVELQNNLTKCLLALNGLMSGHESTFASLCEMTVSGAKLQCKGSAQVVTLGIKLVLNDCSVSLNRCVCMHCTGPFPPILQSQPNCILLPY